MKDTEIIGLLKTYVKQTLVGMGALKGAPCTVQGTVDQGDGTQILTLKWTDDNGVAHTTDISLPSAIFKIVSPTNGQTIRYNGTSGKWENSNVSFSADLGDLDDVVITSATNGQVLTYDAANNRWVNADGSTVAAIGDLTDVTITTVQNGQILVYNTTSQKWENKTINIDDLGNVSITSATDGQILIYNGTSGKWENKALDIDAEDVDYDNTLSGLNATDAQGAIDELADEKVDKVSGKGLSANDFTDTLKTKLDDIEANAEVNDIDTVKVNGTALIPDVNKAVNILLNMTKLSDVDLTDIADEQIIYYDATTQKFINVSAGAVTETEYTAIQTLLS